MLFSLADLLLSSLIRSSQSPSQFMMPLSLYCSSLFTDLLSSLIFCLHCSIKATMNLGYQGLYNQVGSDPEPMTGIIGIRDFVTEPQRNLARPPPPAAANGYQASNSVQPNEKACETQSLSNIKRSTKSPTRRTRSPKRSKRSKRPPGSVPYWPEKYFSHIPCNDDEWATKRKVLGLDSDVGRFLRKLKYCNPQEPFTDVPDHRLRTLCLRGGEFRGSKNQPNGLTAVMYILLVLGCFVQEYLSGNKMAVRAALKRFIPDWNNEYTNKLKKMALTMTRKLQNVHSKWGNCTLEALIYWGEFDRIDNPSHLTRIQLLLLV